MRGFFRHRAIEVGQTVRGKVSGLANFGAFIDLEDNKTGLVHISEVSDKYIKDISDELEEGQEVDVKVLSIADDGKIGLSIRKTKQAQQASDDKPKVEKPKKEAPKQKSQDFDSMMNSFLKDSEDRLSSLKQQTENRRGGRGGHRN